MVLEKFIKLPSPLKLNRSWVAVAMTSPPLIKTVPFTPLVRVSLPVPSDNVRLKETMSNVSSVPITPSVVIVPMTEPTPTGTFT